MTFRGNRRRPAPKHGDFSPPDRPGLSDLIKGGFSSKRSGGEVSIRSVYGRLTAPHLQVCLAPGGISVLCSRRTGAGSQRRPRFLRCGSGCSSLHEDGRCISIRRLAAFWRRLVVDVHPRRQRESGGCHPGTVMARSVGVGVSVTVSPSGGSQQFSQ